MTRWWERPGLEAAAAGLMLEGQSVAAMAAACGTPLYLYSERRVRQNLGQLRAALAGTALSYRIYYALKANRFAPILKTIRAEGDVGIDACSPREVELALAAGFRQAEISVTACMCSDRDLDRMAGLGVHVNLDTISSLRRYAARVPAGTRAGLRIDPMTDAGYAGHVKLGYGNSKLGLHPDGVAEALQSALQAGLAVDTLHMHLGWGLQMRDLPALEEALRVLVQCARRIPALAVINVGGGLGVKHRAADEPLTPEVWAETLGRLLGPLGLTVACEPGTFVVADAGLLVAEVNTVERKGATTWAGVNAGHNINLNPCHYGIPLEVIHVNRPAASAATVYSVVGNINEAADVLARDCPLPQLREGELLAFFPAGAYGSSMASDHCLRGQFSERTV